MTDHFNIADRTLQAFFPGLPLDHINRIVDCQGAYALYRGLNITLLYSDSRWHATVGSECDSQFGCRDALFNAYNEYEGSLQRNLETLDTIRG